MGDDEGARSLSRVQRVRCLACGLVYVKPAGGGTVSANPGCPACGYVGWVLEQSVVRRDVAQRRSVAGRLRRRTG
jgi:hypothetical protein